MLNQKIGILQIFLLVFAVLWIFIIGLDYYNKHPLYLYSFQYFRFPKFITATIAHGLLIVLAARVIKSTKLYVPRVALLLPLLLQFFISVLAYKDFGITETSVGQSFYLARNCLLLVVVLGALSVLLTNLGELVTNFLPTYTVIESKYFISLGFGVVIYTSLLTVFGILNFLNEYVVIGLLALMFLVNPKGLLRKLKTLLVDKIEIRELGWVAIFLGFVLVAYLAINFISLQSPFPNGFDSRNVYINISNLVAKQGGLVSGYPPYNWSLFISTGFFLFDWIELSLGLSFYGYLLAIIVAFHLAKDKLALSTTDTLFVLLAVTATPAITNQLHIELKVDYGLLFFQFLSIYILIESYKRLFHQDGSNQTSKKKFIGVAITLGILVGFGLGIKMINTFLVMTLITVIWLNSKDLFGLIGALLFTLAALLIAQVDQVSGLGDYHLGVGYLKIITLVLSMVFFALSFIKHRKSFQRRFIFTFWFLFTSGVMLSPWLIKTFVETKTLSPKVLFAGENEGVNLNTRKILDNYKRSKK